MTNDIIVAESETDNELATITKYEIVESDLNEIHHNLTSTIDSLKDRLSTMMEFTEAAQNDKMYAAAARMLKTYADLNKAAADVIKQKQELYDSFRTPKDDPIAPIVNNDNRTIALHGTATDILKQVLGNKDEST